MNGFCAVQEMQDTVSRTGSELINTPLTVFVPGAARFLEPARTGQTFVTKPFAAMHPADSAIGATPRRLDVTFSPETA